MNILRSMRVQGYRILSCLLIATLVWTPVQGLVAAESTMTGWLTAGDPELRYSELPSDYTPPYSYNYNTDCDTRDFNVVIREAKPIPVSPYSQSELRYQAACAVNTSRGLTDGVYLDAGVPAGKFAGHSGFVAPIPNSKALMSLRTVINSVSLESMFWNAIVPQYDLITGEVQFNLTGFRFLTDQSGNKIYLRPGSIAYSSDGRWMVADSSVGFIRIDLNDQNKTVLPFAGGFTYGAGFDPAPRVAISPDGRYAAVASGSSMFKIYDLDNCSGDIPATITGSLSCQSKDMQSFLAGKFSGYILSYYIRFASPEFLTFVTAYRDQSGVVHKLEARMVPHGQTIEDVTYLALGDSFSSGEGERDDSYYEEGTNNSSPKNKCHLSKRSYPYLVANTLSVPSFHSVACSGAMYEPDYKDKPQYSDPLAPTWRAGSKKQSDFISSAKPNVVTISMIGNDIGFSGKIIRCLAPDSCFHFKEDRQSIVNEINGKFDALVSLYEDMKQKSHDAKVYVLGYPQILSVTGDCRFSINLDAEERETAKNLTGYLNAVIRAATQRAGVQYIDVEQAFAGHQLCGEGQEAVNGLSSGDDKGILGVNVIGNESFHPNGLGHQLFAEQLLVQSQGFNKPMPVADSSKHAPDTNSQAYATFIGNAPSGGRLIRIAYVGVDTAQTIVKNNTIQFNLNDTLYAPYSVFQAWFNSEPTYAGMLTSDEQGELHGQISVPSSLEPGFHTLHLYGKDLSNKDIDLYETVYVAESINDYDGDGILNLDEKCLANEPINIDVDRDGFDDACDPEISEPPADSMPPQVVGSPDRSANANGWYNADVTISWAAADPDPSSGAPTQPSPTVAGQEGVHTYTSDQSCDPLGNCATGNLELKIDKTAPDIAYSLSPAPNADGWNNSAVTVSFDCTDATSGVASCSEPQTVSGADGMYVVTGSATDNAGNSSAVNVFVSLDSTQPTITQSVWPVANAGDWNNTDVAVASACDDNLAGILDCSPAVALSAEGANQIVESTATDKAGNVSTLIRSVNIDKTAPILGGAIWTDNPKSVFSTAAITIPATDNLSGIAEAEYYLGDTDPGQGNGATMQVNNDAVSVGFNTDFPTGVYKVTVRAKDKAGNWSAPVSDYLVVYDPFGTRMTGKRTLLPSLNNGDVLPGLISVNQSERAQFGFNVRYDETGSIHPHSDFQFKYQTGTNCNKPAQAINCHSLELNAKSIAWLTTQGDNGSTGIFQGTATLRIDGVASNAVFRLTGQDGERLSLTSEDHLTLRVYPEAADPNAATPIYQVGANVLRGNIKIQTW